MADIADKAQTEIDRLWRSGWSAHARRQRAEAARPVNWRGLCDICDEPIAPGRLRADPRAARCIDCQQDYERSIE